MRIDMNGIKDTHDKPEILRGAKIAIKRLDKIFFAISKKYF
jgi:hypothetical protein